MQLWYLCCWAQDDNENNSHLSGPANRERKKLVSFPPAASSGPDIRQVGASRPRLQTESKRLY
jgi:hypothetical protein